jgi:hypothetical protein
MKKNRLIPEQELHNFPFLYSFLTVPEDLGDAPSVKMIPHVAGRIPAIQNNNALLETFYKCISRF